MTTNTLTNLIPTLYQSLNVVSREQVGFIPAVAINAKADTIAKNQTVNIPIVGQNSAVDVTPAMTPPDGGYDNVGNVTMTISNSKVYEVMLSGEEELALDGTGIASQVTLDRFAQGYRTIINLVEADLAALHIYASRAYGTATGTPFATAGDLSDVAQIAKILDDNGAPPDRHMVIGSSATANLRGKQSGLFRVNESGTEDLLRRGVIGDLEGFGMHSSSQVKKLVTAGTNNGSATTNTAGYAIGSTTITLASAGTGTVIAGDIITFAGDTEKYLVVTGDTDVSNGGSIVIAEPGLRQAIPGSATVITTIAATTRNMAFSRSAIALATRAPQMPARGDLSKGMVEYVTDPVSGITFQIAYYHAYRQNKFEIGLAWGVKMIAPRHTALLIGA